MERIYQTNNFYFRRNSVGGIEDIDFFVLDSGEHDAPNVGFGFTKQLKNMHHLYEIKITELNLAETDEQRNKTLNDLCYILLEEISD